MLSFRAFLPFIFSLLPIIKSVLIAPNSWITDSISNSDLKIYTLKTEKLNGVSKDLLLTSTLSGFDGTKHLPIMVVSLKPLPNTDRSAQWICGKIGNGECVIPKEFIQRSERLDIGIFCDECKYSFTATFTQAEHSEVAQSKSNQSKIRNTVNIPTLRLLQQPESTENTNGTTDTNTSLNGDIIKDDIYRLNDLRATGIAGLSVGIIFIITVIIGCVIWMQIFVNTKFVLQPLKLGKIDG